MYSMILPVANAKVFVDQIFRIFDKDGNGDIDFKVIPSDGPNFRFGRSSAELSDKQ